MQDSKLHASCYAGLRDEDVRKLLSEVAAENGRTQHEASGETASESQDLSFTVETSRLFCSLLSRTRFLLPRSSVSFLCSSFPSLHDSISRSSFGNWSGRTLWGLHAVLRLL